ncbi:FAD/NAD(P)-binding protein [Actinacidiphila glaucinigra]|uniref:FAD-NAD(P)-binding n=1 Tax=Actinacidiphila glaucinigra TaxID=235986 RepID=A0A239NMP5_9ACTN|nr:FAD/NAD(P)-binding protein [Actinacidiphila glaucinigra]SNT56171.1 FAD-NAD(P)-binding [Actinacidiphila glaucinigra]
MNRPSHRTHRLAIIGGGPRATYALERLSATIGRLEPGTKLHIQVYERTGEFGAGTAHSPSQPRSSYLNRISCEVGFAADESSIGAGPLRNPADRPTLYDWCRSQFALTGETDFDVKPNSWPKRYVHGLALTDMCATYIAELRAHPDVEVSLEARDVVGIREISGSDDERHGPLEVITADGQSSQADHILMITGHTAHDPRRSPVHGPLFDSAAHNGGTYIPYVYPLDKSLPQATTGPEMTVGCAGTGLTAIDAILHLTEGRGGTFVTSPIGDLVYEPSGDEPSSIVAFSNSGLFTFARPTNNKAVDPARLEHRGVFLSHGTVDALRTIHGTRGGSLGGPVRRQLDFERHLLPVIVLEMAYLHYRALFGAEAAEWLAGLAMPDFRRFLAGHHHGEGPEALLAPLLAGADLLVTTLETMLVQGRAVDHVEASMPSPKGLVRHWIGVVFGPEAQEQVRLLAESPAALVKACASWTSPWALDETPAGNRFSWKRTLTPLGISTAMSPGDYREAVLDMMRRDHLWALQGNIDNPHKAAADGVWRDLREVICYAVDDAGLTPHAQRTFAERYVRHHNRLANGAGLEVMERIRALIRHGLLDISVGPGATVRGDGSGGFTIEGPLTGTSRRVDVLADARLHTFDPYQDASPLYRDLLSAGICRQWRNEDADGNYYVPGGLELTAEFQPVRADGGSEPRITVLGPAARGHRTFLMDALKPGRDHYVMRDIGTWARTLWHHLAHPRKPDQQGLDRIGIGVG